MDKKKGIKGYFVRGLIVFLPMLVTLFIFIVALRFIINNIGIPLGKGVLIFINWISSDTLAIYLTGNTTKTFEEILQSHLYTALLGVPLALILLFVTGILVATFIGRRLYRLFDKLLSRFPIIKMIYPYAKQVTEFFLSREERFEFHGVVAVPYPRKDVYTIGFITSQGIRAINEHTSDEYVSVYLPTSPTPITGVVIFVKKSETLQLPMSVETALRFFVSGGVIIPKDQRVLNRPRDNKGGMDDVQI